MLGFAFSHAAVCERDNGGQERGKDSRLSPSIQLVVRLLWTDAMISIEKIAKPSMAGAWRVLLGRTESR